ncbi:DsrE/DsrF/DrsH-like family protein [Bacillus sp. CLL-7-23]|uniref:DsrE/DsrF/DrsH-like family protein n=1 Tax=Bacillus changyiensis TaxID=3004103 RepID=A0ABT4X6Z5_9BACI|nr:DsrE/DsrF/DrsH-like family protein [Bacillus changyiensis]MDA7027970.1 DsrE/DsrF/DrsH-like family protein [Bacillus changyiensis]
MPNQKTNIILFSGDYDKAMAAFIIANGAAAYDHEVTIFFTFWGLNTLKKENIKTPIAKRAIEKMFGWMMPKSADHLPLSKMNMLGLGPKMIKHVIKKHHALSLPQLIELANEQGVKLIACTMTMDLLGIKQEELIDGTEFGGVAAYLGEASEGQINLFI